MIVRIIVLVSVCLFSLGLIASPTILMSQVKEEWVDTHLKPAIIKSYSAIDIDIELVEVSIERGLKGVSSGFFDADLARLKYTAEAIDNVIILEPILAEVVMRVYCRETVVCQPSVLDNKRASVAAPRGNPVIQSFLRPGKHTIVVYVSDFEQVKLMYHGHRFDYFVWFQTATRAAPVFEGFKGNSFDLHRFDVVHVLNKKNAHLAQQLSEQLKQYFPIQ